MKPSPDTAASDDAARPARPITPWDRQSLPPLNHDQSFWGMIVTQFLGAFNDNLFKQLILLLAVPVGAAAVTANEVARDGGTQANHREEDQQWLATVVFSLPFVLFSGFAGFLSDRFSKRSIIVLSKMAEIVAMLLGLLAFATYGMWLGYPGLLGVLFFMGTQSAFFGPGKYGIFPEMLREPDLPRANGVMVMTTFLAIILGTAAAGGLGDLLVDPHRSLQQSASRLWMASALCVGIAIAGTATSLLLRRVPAAKPDLQFRLSSLTVPPDTRQLLRGDHPLVMALLASCVFWLVSGVAIQAVNSLGLVQLRLNKSGTSLLAATIGVGIAIGAMIAGRLSRGRVDFRLVRVGAWGIVAFLVLLSISRPGGVHLLGFFGSIPVLTLLGMSAGFFAIPVQVFIQTRPPAEQKGRAIAVMNQMNFIAILLSGFVYLAFDRLVVAQQWPRSAVFAMMAILMLPVAVLYRPRSADRRQFSEA